MTMKIDNKIKVMRIFSRLNIGGPSIHTILLTSGLNKKLFNSILVVGREGPDEGNMMDLAEQKNVQPIIISEMQREISLKNDFISIKRILSLIIKEQPKIVHTHTAKAGFLGRISIIIFKLIPFILLKIPKHKKRIKVFHTFHGNIFTGYFGSLKTKLFIYIEKFLAIFTTKIICLNELQKEELMNFGITSKNKIVTIPLGLELNRFIHNQNKGLLRSELKIKEDIILIGIVARLVPIKNHLLFVNGIMNLINANFGNKIRALIIGDGESRKSLEEYVKNKSLSKYIHFLGFRNDLESIYSDLDIVALTSNNEGTPVALIEAMANNLPIITTNVGGIGNIVGVGKKIIDKDDFLLLENGIMINANDLNGFTKALLYMCDNKAKRISMGKDSRRLVYPRYDISMLYKNIESLYLNN